MIKTLLLAITSFLLLLSPVTLEAVTLPDEIHQKTIVYTEQDGVSFTFFQLYEDPRFNINYGYTIKTKKDVSLEISCDQDSVLVDNINVLLYKEVTTSFHPNEFVGVCQENDEASILISDSDGELITAGFVYQTKLNSTVQYMTTTSLNTSSADIPDTAVPFTISISVILVLSLLFIFLYRRRYQSYLNQALEDNDVVHKPKFDVPTSIIVTSIISIVLIVTTLVSIHYIYKNTYIYDVSVEDQTIDILELDATDITLEESKYQRFTVSIDLDVISVNTYEADLDVSETQINTYVTNILEDYNDTVVGYNDWSLNIMTESEKRYFLSYSTSDDATIEFRFVLDENDNPILTVYYFPAVDETNWSEDELIFYGNHEYYFNVPIDNPDFIALYDLLQSERDSDTS